MKIEAIVVAAGAGKRLKGAVRKPYINLFRIPIIVRTLQALSNSNSISDIVVVVNKLDKMRCEGLIKRYKIKKIKAVVSGGKERFNSVYNGLAALDEDTDIVLIHDGVRPFIDKDIIKRSIDCAKRFGACVVGVPVKATIKKVTSAPVPQRPEIKIDRRTGVLGYWGTRELIVEGTIDRSNLWEVQTPQVFRKDVILKAYKNSRDYNATDDAVLVEQMGFKVRVAMGSYRNIKITTPEDLMLAKSIGKWNIK